MAFKTIMIIDDSEADQMITEIMIKDYNPEIEVIKAYDGEEALGILKTLDKEPSLILLDINMPRMDGFEFLESYKEMYKGAVVVMLSSSDQKQDKDKAFSYDVVKDYFVKPIDLDDLKKLEDLL